MTKIAFNKKVLSQRELFREKEKFHREMAKLPFEEKIKVLFKLQKIAKAIKKTSSPIKNKSFGF